MIFFFMTDCRISFVLEITKGKKRKIDDGIPYNKKNYAAPKTVCITPYENGGNNTKRPNHAQYAIWIPFEIALQWFPKIFHITIFY